MFHDNELSNMFHYLAPTNDSKESILQDENKGIFITAIQHIQWKNKNLKVLRFFGT